MIVSGVLVGWFLDTFLFLSWFWMFVALLFWPDEHSSRLWVLNGEEGSL